MRRIASRRSAVLLGSWLFWVAQLLAGGSGNRLVYLDAEDPFYVGHDFPKLTTPQWFGEPGVEAVVTLGIDDMSSTAKYEAFLRPILERLKQIDGHAPVSIFCNAVTPEDPQLQAWLKEGLSLEVHTLSHPCPILGKGDFAGAEATFHGGVDLLNHVPGNRPVAFRTPCCDSINSPSPRVFAELINRTNNAGQFLQMDSSVMVVLSTNDASLPQELLVDPDGQGRFAKYLPFHNFVTTVENYPFPWIIGNRCWEFPCMVPSDWEAQHILGPTNRSMVPDWKAALDATVLKQGVFNFVFHPHGWSSSAQFVEFIDYAVSRYGRKVRFLTYPEALRRLTDQLTAGESLRTPTGGDRGVRLLDLNQDGYLDAIIANGAVQKTRVWDPSAQRWVDSSFPTPLVRDSEGSTALTGVRFGVLDPQGSVTMLVRNEVVAGMWTFTEGRWVQDPNGLRGLELEGQPIWTSQEGRDRGVRLRDVDGDGVCELLVSNESQNAVFQWNGADHLWERLPFGLPTDTALVDLDGHDQGLRFVDLNEDGHDDVVFSNEAGFSAWLYVPKPLLGWERGWTRKLLKGERKGWEPGKPTPADELPVIARSGNHPNNGAWIHSRQLWVQNEHTAAQPDLVEHRSFDELLNGSVAEPLSPEEALRSFQVRGGFHVELVAAEPLVQDPVAIDFGADGRLWVAEMRDYPLGMDGHGKPGGVIKFLEDTDCDGRYDKATTFLTEVPFPSSVMAWRGGVLVTAAPDLFFAEDTDGDGRADRRRLLFTGFVEGNQQHRVNGFALGLDGWVYGANGDSGGTVRWRGIDQVLTATGWSNTAATSADRSPVGIQGRDFRFRPDTDDFEAIEGSTQYGRVRDDWGNWFGNANYTWLWHYPLPARYVARNPNLAVREMRSMLTQQPGAERVFPASRSVPRPNVVGAENTVTSACSACPYRDDVFGPDFATSVFISEPSENLIHREVLSEAGVTYRSQRASGEEATEFVASKDPWCRPTQLKIGPDGALYFADMYRRTIEHPEWIPADMQAHSDLRAGADRGRIYRVVPDGVVLRSIPRLDRWSATELVAGLESPSGWQRDAAMRRLWETSATNVASQLAELAERSPRATTRGQALCTLGGLGVLRTPSLLRALADSDPGVRALALRWSEPELRAAPSAPLVAAVFGLVGDPSDRVVYQLALSLGELRDPRVPTALAAIAQRFREDPWMQQAVLSSSAQRSGALLTALSSLPQPPAQWVEKVLGLAALEGDDTAVLRGIELLAQTSASRDNASPFAALARVLDATERRGRPLSDSCWKAATPVLFRAREVALNEAMDDPDRVQALELCGRAGAIVALPPTAAAQLLSSRSSPAVQRAALGVFARSDQDAVAAALMEVWPQLSPGLHGRVVEVLMTRPAWTRQLMAAIRAGSISAREISPSARQQLLASQIPEVRAEALTLFAAVSADRGRVVDSFASAKTKAGDPDRGREVFVANCAPCHRLQGTGIAVGPDLGAVVDKSAEALLIAILDPNRAVEERYLSYTARRHSGPEFTGLIANESPNSVTLRAANGVEEVVLRSELISLVGTHHSLMPEGFEHSIEVPAMADLLAYLQATTAKPKVLEGNRPRRVEPASDGTFHLEAAVAEVYGDSLVFETGYRNLGFWQSENDRALWTLNVPRRGEYELWLDWASPAGRRTPQLRVEVAGQPNDYTVPGTGSWDVYQQMRLGRIQLEPGVQSLVAKAIPPIQQPILDLRQLRLVPVGQAPPADFSNLRSR